MFFIRAIGTASRPESDVETIYDALQWVHEHRGVDIEIVLDDSTLAGVNRTQANQRFESIGDVGYCYNGCLNTNKRSRFPSAIEHEKYLAISDTTWDTASGDHPLVFSSSGNWARSQIRNYWQEATLVYDDQKLYDEFEARHAALMSCTKGEGDCKSGSKAITALNLKKDRKIWIDRFYRRSTDSGRGTFVAFAPQASDAPDYYVSQFDGLDCKVDTKVRIAMFKLTDTKAERMADSLSRLKKQGCNVEMLISQSYAANEVSAKVKKKLKNANIPFYCSAIPMHTKMILIGPMTGNEGRVLVGTANMSTSGLRYSDEHVLTLDTRLATGAYQESMRRAYGEYLAGWDALAQGRNKC